MTSPAVLFDIGDPRRLDVCARCGHERRSHEDGPCIWGAASYPGHQCQCPGFEETMNKARPLRVGDRIVYNQLPALGKIKKIEGNYAEMECGTLMRLDTLLRVEDPGNPTDDSVRQATIEECAALCDRSEKECTEAELANEPGMTNFEYGVRAREARLCAMRIRELLAPKKETP